MSENSVGKIPVSQVLQLFHRREDYAAEDDLLAGEEDDGGGDGDEHEAGKVVKHVLALGVCHAL